MAHDQAALHVLYGELRQVARAMLRREPYDHTLESCELVNQAWMRILNGGLADLAREEPTDVIALAVTNMRRELVDHARRRKAAKRPTSARRVDLDDVPRLSHEQPELFLEVDRLLKELAQGPERVRHGARKAEAARYALYGGLSEAEIAALTGVPKSTVGADVRFARAWLGARLEDEGG